MAEAAKCYECGKSFNNDEMIKYDNNWVCAGCKPIFLQKLKEGVSVTGAMEYAGFWIRFGAQFLDQIILTVVTQMIGFVMGTAAGASGQPNIGLIGIVFVINMAIIVSYDAFFLGKYGATPGKMACGLRVVTAEGEPISYGRAVGRHFAKYLSGMIFLIGYIMAAFDDERRALHDRICNTRVIKK
jgi:uncharacterized RDD family membrane protein YckC